MNDLLENTNDPFFTSPFAPYNSEPTAIPSDEVSQVRRRLEALSRNFNQLKLDMQDRTDKMSDLACELYSLDSVMKHLADNSAASARELESLRQQVQSANGKLDHYQESDLSKNQLIQSLEERCNALEYELHQAKEKILADQWNRETIEKQYCEVLNKLQEEEHRKPIPLSVSAEAIPTPDIPIAVPSGIRLASDTVVSYARILLETMDAVRLVLEALNSEVSEYYQFNDDVNFFYVRRRLKFMETNDSLSAYWQFYAPVSLLAQSGMLACDGPFQSIVVDDPYQSLESFKYFVYSHLSRNLIGSALIMLREMMNMEVYTGVSNRNSLNTITTLHRRLIDLSARLGYRIVDVDLFCPLPASSDVECVEQVDVNFEGVASGDVCEIVQLAVLFGSATGKTKVKIKK